MGKTFHKNTKNDNYDDDEHNTHRPKEEVSKHKIKRMERALKTLDIGDLMEDDDDNFGEEDFTWHEDDASELEYREYIKEHKNANV